MARFPSAFICIVFTGIAFALRKNTADPISPNLKLVVTVEGKSYYADNTYRNWTASGEYCQSEGMQLAAIESNTEEAALRNAYSSDFSGFYWTAGRDAQINRQFLWNGTGDEVASEYYFYNGQDKLDYQTCLFYLSLSRNASGFAYWRCSFIYGVLCQTNI